MFKKGFGCNGRSDFCVEIITLTEYSQYNIHKNINYKYFIVNYKYVIDNILLTM